MKPNYPTNKKSDGPEIHVELFRIPTKPIISRKELREKEFEENQKRMMDLLRKAGPNKNENRALDEFNEESARFWKKQKIGERMALIALILAFFNLCFILIRMVLK